MPIAKPPIFSLNRIINGFLQSHKLDECNELFVTGGPYTTPHISTIYPGVPSPWRSACLFVILLSLCLGAMLLEQYTRIELDNAILFLAAVATGNVFAPLSLVLFLSELNVWRNIPLLRTGYQIAGGGLLSIAFAMVLFLFNRAESPVVFSLLTGLTEEAAKVAACVVLAGRKLRNGRILNGMLVGAAVGAGFSLIESMGYTFEALVGTGVDGLVALDYRKAFSTMGVRAIYSMTAGHVTWGAITAGVLWAVCRRRSLGRALCHPVFLAVVGCVSALHCAWNICCYTGMELPALPLFVLVTWGALGVVIHRGMRQVYESQRLWYDTASEQDGVFSLRGEDETWGRPVSAMRVQELLARGEIAHTTLCRAGECTIPVPVWHLAFIPKLPEGLCAWWREPRCMWYRANHLLAIVQVLSLLASLPQQGYLITIIIYLLALAGQIVLNFRWLVRLWKWALRRFPQNDAEKRAAAFSPRYSASMWWRMLIPFYNVVWGYRLYVNIVRRYNAGRPAHCAIPLWIPRLYWGCLTAVAAMAVTMILHHEGQSFMWHLLILFLLHPLFAFFVSRAMNAIHRSLRTYA